MAVYNDQDNRGLNRKLSDGDEQLRHVMTPEEEREAEQRAYDEQFAGIVSANDLDGSSDRSRSILDQERAAAKGNTGVYGPSVAGGVAGGAGKGTGGKDTDKSADEPSDSETKKGLFKQEEGGGFYRKEASKHLKSGTLKLAGIAFNSKKRVLALITSLIITFATAVASFFAALSPFQLPSITQFLENIKYAALNNATDKVMQRLFTSYLKHVLLPGMRAQGCPSTKINKSCVGDLKGEGPVRLLYNKWSGKDKSVASIEYKLAQAGIEITFNKANGQYYMKSPRLGNGVSLADVENGNVSNVFDMKEVSRADVRAELNRAFEQGVAGKKKLFRNRTGPFLKKYGIIRCLAACDFKDKTYGKYQDKKRAGLAWFNRRILEPRSELMGLYLNCLLNPCKDEIKSLNDEATNNEPMDTIRRDSRAMLSAYSAKYSSDKLDELVKKIENLSRDGIALHLTRGAIEKIGGKLLPDRTIDANAIINKLGKSHIYILLIRIFILLYKASDLKTMNYQINAALGVSLFEIARTASHESRSGHMDATMLGSVTNLFRHGAFNSGPGMEESPIYEQEFALAKATPTAAFMNTILPQKIHAQSNSTGSSARPTICADGHTIYENRTTDGAMTNLVCDELRLSYSNLATKTSDLLRLIPGLSYIMDILQDQLDLFDDIVSAPSDFAIWLLKKFPIIGDIIEAIEAKMQELVDQALRYFLNLMLKNPLGDRPSGSRQMEMLIMGAEVGGNDAAHRIIGGQALTDGQLAEIQNEELQKRQDEFAILPLRERMFSVDTTYSFTSQLALNLPSDPQAAAQRSFAQLLSNPFQTMATSFASVFSAASPAYAAATPQQSAFDIEQYGFPADLAFYKEDPLTYWDRECKDGWAEKGYNQPKDLLLVTPSKPPHFLLIPFMPVGPPIINDKKLVEAANKYGYTIDDRHNQISNSVSMPCFALNSFSKYDEPITGGGGAGTPAGQTLDFQITGYTWQDNTPPNSNDICCSIIHPKADGTGTFEDPITTAVPGSGSSMEIPPGTKFYVPHIQRYVIVEDSGATPTADYNNGALGHLDIWVDGRGGTKADSDECAAAITGKHPVEKNPPAGRTVMVGKLWDGGCKLPAQAPDPRV